MTAPKLRFKEFDKDWNTVNLKNCIESIDSGWSPQCESYPANSSQWGILKTTSVDWSGFQENANKKLPDHLEPRPEIEVKPYDILVTRAGPTERVGVVSVVPNNVRKKLLISDKLIRIKSDKDNDPNFLGISLSSSKCQNQLQSKTSGLAKSQTNISQKILLDVTLQTPFKAEQTKIATFLSAVDEKISQLSQKLHLLGQYKQGMMQKLFSQQIRFKADDGSEFGEWEERKLSDICLKIKDGTHFSPKTLEVGDYKYLTSKNVKNGYLDFSNLEFVNAEDHKKIYSSCDVKFGDVLLTKDGTIGQCCVNTLTEEFSLLSSVAFLRLKTQFNNYFLYHLLVSDFGQREINGVIAGQALKRITLTKINDFKFMFPCFEEQTKIANFLSAIDQKIDVVKEQLEQAKLWKKGLLQQMFV